MLPLAGEELLRLRFCSGFLGFFVLFSKGSYEGFGVYVLFFVFTSFPCNLFIGAWLGQQKYLITVIFVLALKRKC